VIDPSAPISGVFVPFGGEEGDALPFFFFCSFSGKNVHVHTSPTTTTTTTTTTVPSIYYFPLRLSRPSLLFSSARRTPLLTQSSTPLSLPPRSQSYHKVLSTGPLVFSISPTTYYYFHDHHDHHHHHHSYYIKPFGLLLSHNQA
jgi:hypothetical protein